VLMVVGLGNPGKRYEQTRHNVGFRVVDTLVRRWSIPADTKQLGALVGHGSIRQSRATLVRPQGYMNCSGQPVASLLGYFKATVGDMLVIHDDLDLPFGEVRLKVGGGHRGHNGLRDIIQHVGADFARIRIGIGRPPEGWDPADYVLARFTEPELAALDGLFDAAADLVEEVAGDGLAATVARQDARSAPAPSRPRGGPAGPPSSSGRHARGRPANLSITDPNAPDAPSPASEEIS